MPLRRCRGTYKCQHLRQHIAHWSRKRREKQIPAPHDEPHETCNGSANRTQLMAHPFAQIQQLRLHRGSLLVPVGGTRPVVVVAARAVHPSQPYREDRNVTLNCPDVGAAKFEKVAQGTRNGVNGEIKTSAEGVETPRCALSTPLFSSLLLLLSSHKMSCSKCSKKITGNTYKVLEHVYCRECYACSSCNQKLVGQFFPVDGQAHTYLCSKW